MAETSQPWFTVQLDMSGCAYDVRVNDAPLYESVNGLPVVVEIPANRLLHNGGNEISFHLAPLAGKPSLNKDCKCTAIVYRRDTGTDRESRQEVARLEYPGVAPVRREGNLSVIAAPFAAQVPFAMFRWFSSPEIAEGEETRLSLVAEMGGLYSILAERNLDGIVARLAERDREEAAAMYQTPQAKVAETRRQFSELFDEAAYSLRPLRTTARLRLFAHGRLARLDMNNGQSPLYYLTADRQTAGYVTLVFCRNVAGGWMVVR